MYKQFNRIAYIVGALFIVFFGVIPAYYILVLDDVNEKNIKSASGKIVVYKSTTSNRTLRIGISIDGKNIKLSCKSSLVGSHIICDSSKLGGVIGALGGKSAYVKWHAMKTSPFTVRNVVLQLKIEGDEYIPTERGIEGVAQGKKRVKYEIFAMVIILLIGIIVSETLFIRGYGEAVLKGDENQR